MKIIFRITPLVLAFGWQPTVFSQTKDVDIHAEEAAIRAIINGQQPAPRTPDSVFWSGAYPRPIVGQETVKPFDESAIQQRRNQKSEFKVVRLDVAAAGDMAYDFSDFTLSWDVGDTKEHVSFTGSALEEGWRTMAGGRRLHATT